MAVYRWGDGDWRVMLVHGWAGKAAQFFALIGAVRDRGLAVCAVDAAAHGNSSGVFASSPAFARAARRVGELDGPFYGVVWHSLGATATSIALAQGLEVQHAVLLAPVAFVEPLLEMFIKLHALPEPLAAKLREQFAARYSSGIISVPILAKDFRIPALIYHDPDDGYLSFSHSEAILRAWSGAQLVPAPGAGHWPILRDHTVLKGTHAFLTHHKT